MISIVEYQKDLLADMLFDADLGIDETLADYLKDPKVQKFIELSQKELEKKSDTQDKRELKTLFQDNYIQSYIKAAEHVGRRNGWLYGGTGGSVIGYFSTALGLTVSGLAAPATALVLGVIGAVFGGLGIGVLSAKLNSVFKRWRAENQLTSGEHSSVVLAGGTKSPLMFTKGV